MTKHTIRDFNYGPTDHFSGNSLVNKRCFAAAAISAIVTEIAAGDWIDESIHDCDDMTVAELDQQLKNRGLKRGNLYHEGCEIVNAG